MMLITALALVADWLCFRQIFLKESAGYSKFSYLILLAAVGASLFLTLGFFTKRFFMRRASE
jgi:hypothetical protein